MLLRMSRGRRTQSNAAKMSRDGARPAERRVGARRYRYSRKIYHLPLQRWTIRILLVGPVYSCLMWIALWVPEADYYVAVPVGFYVRAPRGTAPRRRIAATPRGVASIVR